MHTWHAVHWHRRERAGAECRGVNPSLDFNPLFHPTGSSLPGVVFLALALGSLALWPRVVSELARTPWDTRRRDVLLGVGLFAAAFALRWGLASHALVHENHHGYHHVSSSGPVNTWAESHGVPSSHMLLLNLFGAVVGVSDESTFLFDASLSAVAVVALAVFTVQVTGSRHAGWAAAALLGLQPLAIALGPTEEFLVSASGLCLAGMALLHAGARLGLRATLALGVALLCLGAGSREVTLPLSALALPAMLSARTAAGRPPWRATLAVCAAVAVLLLPQAIRVIVAWRSLGATPAYFGAPVVPWLFDGGASLHGRNPRWMGWFEPFIPRWEGWAMVCAPALLGLWCTARRDARLAVGVLLPAATALLQGGLTRSGWFPTHLRHQLLAMALLLLPVAACVGLLAGTLPARVRALLPAVIALLAAVSLARRPGGYHLDLALTQEYRFFRQALAAAPAEGVAVAFDDDPLSHLPGSWISVQRPSWAVIPSGSLPAVVASRSHRSLFLTLDRACFVDVTCLTLGLSGCGDTRLRDVIPSVPTAFGHVTPQCARALEQVPWRVVATRTVQRTRAPNLEMPSVDEAVHIALLRWDRP